VLRRITKANLKGFLHLLDYGYDDTLHEFFLVTELLGSDVNTLMQRCPERKFSLETTVKVAQQMLQRIKDFHKLQLIH